MTISLTNSLFSWTDTTGATQTLDVDVVMGAQDKRTAKLTDHVVEMGAVITDHVIIQPESLSLDLVVTQTPVTGAGMRAQSLSIKEFGQTLLPRQYPLNVPPSRFQPGGFLLVSSAVRGVVTDAADTLLAAVGLADRVDNSKMSGSAVTIVETSRQVSTLQADAEADRVVAVHDTLIGIMNGRLLVTVSFKGRLYIDYLLTEVELSHQAGKFGCGTFKVQARAFRTVTGVAVSLPSPADFRAKASAKKGNKPGTTPDPDPTKAAAKSFAARGADTGVGGAILNAAGLGGLTSGSP